MWKGYQDDLHERASKRTPITPAEEANQKKKKKKKKKKKREILQSKQLAPSPSPTVSQNAMKTTLA